MSETESNQEGFIEMSFEEVSAVEMLERAVSYTHPEPTRQP